jgi:uncharacterized protein YdaU (DUF1376 family)
VNYFEKHIGDWIRDTVSLTMLEDGAYNRLIDQYYQTERPLPNDKKLVYRLARANSSAERKAVDFVIENFFERTDAGYVQKRAEAELERYSEKRAKAQASANARWNRSEGNANASQPHDASDMRTHSVGNAHQSPDTSNQTPTTKHQTPEPPKGKDKDAPATLELPDWIPEDAWTAFVAMRKKIKAPLTDDAVRLAIDKLAKLMQAGHRPREVLEQSTLNSWRGLFEIRAVQHSNGSPDSRQAFNERENAKAKQLLFGAEIDHAT